MQQNLTANRNPAGQEIPSVVEPDGQCSNDNVIVPVIRHVNPIHNVMPYMY
jgi:hypothetical protein